MNDKSKRGVQITLSRSSIIVLAVVLLFPWLIALYPGWRVSREKAGEKASQQEIFTHAEVQSGPWGNLRIEPIILDYPSSCAVYDFDAEPYRRWTFRNSSLGEIRKRFDQVGMDQTAADALAQTAVADAGIKGFVIHPPDDVVRGFAPALRAALYAELGRNPDASVQARPFMFRGRTVSEWFFRSGVRQEMVEKIEPLVYRRGSYLVFSDPQVILPGMTSRVERVALYRALHRTSTYRVRVCLKEGEKADSILAYWCRPNRDAEIEPLVTALAAEHDGLSVLCFLPEFARMRLYTYPPPRATGDVSVRDCHWASLNFFNAVPDDGRNGTTLGNILPLDYVPVQIPTHLGDVVLLFNGERVVHSCVYIAGDIVFTKNGLGVGDPFVFEKMDDVAEHYRGLYGEIHLGFCRHKGT